MRGDPSAQTYATPVGLGTGAANSDFSWAFQRHNTDYVSFWYWNGSTMSSLISTTKSWDITWHHVAVTREGTSLKLFIDGINEASTTLSDGFVFSDSTTVLGIGSRGACLAATTYKGYLDELRISKGIARWTSDFTPPTSQYVLKKL